MSFSRLPRFQEPKDNGVPPVGKYDPKPLPGATGPVTFYRSARQHESKDHVPSPGSYCPSFSSSGAGIVPLSSSKGRSRSRLNSWSSTGSLKSSEAGSLNSWHQHNVRGFSVPTTSFRKPVKPQMPKKKKATITEQWSIIRQGLTDLGFRFPSETCSVVQDCQTPDQLSTSCGLSEEVFPAIAQLMTVHNDLRREYTALQNQHAHCLSDRPVHETAHHLATAALSPIIDLSNSSMLETPTDKIAADEARFENQLKELWASHQLQLDAMQERARQARLYAKRKQRETAKLERDFYDLKQRSCLELQNEKASLLAQNDQLYSQVEQFKAEVLIAQQKLALYKQGSDQISHLVSFLNDKQQETLSKTDRLAQLESQLETLSSTARASDAGDDYYFLVEIVHFVKDQAAKAESLYSELETANAELFAAKNALVDEQAVSKELGESYQFEVAKSAKLKNIITSFESIKSAFSVLKPELAAVRSEVTDGRETASNCVKELKNCFVASLNCQKVLANTNHAKEQAEADVARLLLKQKEMEECFASSRLLLESEFSELKSDYESIKELLDEERAECCELRARSSTLHQELLQKQAHCERLEENVMAEQEKFVALESTLFSLRDEMLEIKESAATLDNNVNQLSVEREALMQKTLQQDQVVLDLQNELQQYITSLDEANRQCAELNLEKEGLKHDMAKLSVEMQSIAKEKMELASCMERLSKELQLEKERGIANERTYNQSLFEVEEWRQKAENYENIECTLRLKLQDCTEARTLSHNECLKLQVELESLREQNAKLVTFEEELTMKLQLTQESVATLDNNVNHLSVERETLIEKTQHQDQVVLELQQRITSLDEPNKRSAELSLEKETLQNDVAKLTVDLKSIGDELELAKERALASECNYNKLAADLEEYIQKAEQNDAAFRLQLQTISDDRDLAQGEVEKLQFEMQSIAKEKQELKSCTENLSKELHLEKEKGIEKERSYNQAVTEVEQWRQKAENYEQIECTLRLELQLCTEARESLHSECLKLQVKLDSLREQNVKLVTSGEELTKKLQHAQAKVDEQLVAIVDLTSLREQVSKYEAEIAKLKEEHLQLVNENLQFIDQLKHSNAEIDRLKQEAPKRTNTVAELTEKVKAMAVKDFELQNTVKIMQATNAQLQQQALADANRKQQNNQLRQQLLQLERELEELRRDLQAKDNIIERQKVEIEELENVIEPFKDHLNAFMTERNALLSREQCSKKLLEDISVKYASILGHQNNKQKIKHIQDLKTELQNLRQEVMHLRSETVTRKRRIDQLEIEKRKLEVQLQKATTTAVSKCQDKENSLSNNNGNVVLVPLGQSHNVGHPTTSNGMH